jgi:DNA primase
MLFDTDKAGEAAMVRSLNVLIDERMDVKVAVLTKNDDPDSFIRAHGVKKFYQQIQQAKTLFDFKLDSLISKYGDDTVEKRAKIAADILPNIKQFHNAIVRSEYIKQLSQRLSISQDALLLELKKTEQSGSTLRKFNRISNESRRGAGKHLRTVERNILKLMLEEQEFIPLTKRELKIGDFQNEYARSIIKKIYEIFDQKNEVNASALVACFDDQNISQKEFTGTV